MCVNSDTAIGNVCQQWHSVNRQWHEQSIDDVSGDFVSTDSDTNSQQMMTLMMKIRLCHLLPEKRVVTL